MSFSKYTYIDYQEKPPKIIFQCEADNILEADHLYKVATGKNVSKQAHIGCQIEEK